MWGRVGQGERVLACSQCNQTRADVEDNMLSLLDKWRRSRVFPWFMVPILGSRNQRAVDMALKRYRKRYGRLSWWFRFFY